MRFVEYLCSDCDFVGSNASPATTRYFYRTSTEDIPVLRLLAICSDCDQVVAAEIVPGPNDAASLGVRLLKEGEKLRELRASQGWMGKLFGANADVRRQEDELVALIDSLTQKVTQTSLASVALAERKNKQPRCLNCGSHHFTPLPEHHAAGKGEAPARVGLKHKCGGELLARWIPAHFSIKAREVFIDTNGLGIRPKRKEPQFASPTSERSDAPNPSLSPMPAAERRKDASLGRDAETHTTSPPKVTRQLKPGEFIAGEIRVLDVFGGEGKSGMGVVYLVSDRDAPHPYVLKALQGSEEKGVAMRRFLTEAEGWINVGSHPNVVQAYWVRRLEGRLFVAAEYVRPDESGRNTVADYISRGAVPLPTCLQWAASFCFAMEHARQRGIVAHRDVKPENLMVDPAGQLKVTDFGLARVASAPAAPGTLPDVEAEANVPARLTGVRAGLGTILYMPPEQFVDAGKVDHRADIYSFGIVLYAMVSGGAFPYPLSGRSAQELYAAHSTANLNELHTPRVLPRFCGHF